MFGDLPAKLPYMCTPYMTVYVWFWPTLLVRDGVSTISASYVLVISTRLST